MLPAVGEFDTAPVVVGDPENGPWVVFPVGLGDLRVSAAPG